MFPSNNFLSSNPSPRSVFVIPQGVVRITVVEAKDLIAADIAVFGKGSSDPYVVLRGKTALVIVKARFPQGENGHSPKYVNIGHS